MTRMLFREDPICGMHRTVVAHTAEGGIVLDATSSIPQAAGSRAIAVRLSGTIKSADRDCRKGEGDQIVLVPPSRWPCRQSGPTLSKNLDWDRRHKHMRVHTALHLLSVAVPFGVTGGSISATHGRLDFDMPDAPDDAMSL